MKLVFRWGGGSNVDLDSYVTQNSQIWILILIFPSRKDSLIQDRVWPFIRKKVEKDEF